MPVRGLVIKHIAMEPRVHLLGLINHTFECLNVDTYTKKHIEVVGVDVVVAETILNLSTLG